MDQGKFLLEMAVLILRFLREIREIWPKKEKTPTPHKPSKQKR